jgi:hypothetical protein
MKSLLLNSLILLFLSSYAFAGDCLVTVTRTACPGHEAESYSKCDGKQTCTEKFVVATPQDCSAATLNACVNVPARQQITKSKVITSEFDGKTVEGGRNFCDPNRPDFNKCLN